MPACSTAFEGRAEEVLVIRKLDGDARHRSVDRSNACAAQAENHGGMPSAANTSAQGVGRSASARAPRRDGPSSHHARATAARRLGAKLSGNIKPDRGALALRTMIVP